MSSPSRVAAIRPHWAIEGGRITIDGTQFPLELPSLPEVRIGDLPARVVYASPTSLAVIVPTGITEGGQTPVRIEGVAGETALIEVAAPFATGLHQVDNPIFDRDGNLYVTYSGTRGQQVPVSIFRVRPNGTRESFSSGIVNPTSMALDPEGQLYVSSRFEGTVYRVARDGSVEVFANDLGIPCGLAFATDGTLFVGDRSGTIFRVDRTGEATTFATLPASVAAFHLAYGPDDRLYVTGPTLSSYDSLYQVDRDGHVTTRYERFGRPKGVAFDTHGGLHVVEAIAGMSGLSRIKWSGEAELVVAGEAMVGFAFD